MAGHQASRTRKPYGLPAVDETYADGGGIAAFAVSSSNACVSCLGFIRTRTVSGFGLIRFHPAFVTVPPTMARTRYIAPVNRTMAKGWRIPVRSKLRLRPAAGSNAVSWGNVTTRRPRPRASTPIPRSRSMWSRFRRAIGALETAGVHKGRDSVLKADNGSASPAKDRAHAQELRLGEWSERAVLRLRGDPRTQGVDGHLSLLRRPSHAHVDLAALDLFPSDHGDVRHPVFLGGPDFLREGVRGVVEVRADAVQTAEDRPRVVELVCAHRHDSDLRRREPDGKHWWPAGFRVRRRLLKESVHDSFDCSARGEMENERGPLRAFLVREGDSEPLRVFRVDLVGREGRSLVVRVDEVEFVLQREVEELLRPPLQEDRLAPPFRVRGHEVAMVPPERLRDAHADFEVVGHGEAAILEELPGDLESDHELRFRLLDVRA